MILNVYSVHDEKIPAFARPFYMGSHPQAIRAFGENCADPQSMLAKFPTDFKLYYLGTYNETDGIFKNEKLPVFLASAVEFVKIKAIKKDLDLVDTLADAGRE